MKNTLLFSSLCLVVCCVVSQAQASCPGTSIAWQKLAGGSDTDKAYDLKQTSDGGYIVVGGSKSSNGDVTGNHGDEDFWIVKTDDAGSIAWQKSYGGSMQDEARSVGLTSDGGYIVAGFSFSTNGDVTGHHAKSDYWIIRLSASGELMWQKSLGGNGKDEAYSIHQTIDGGYIVAGYTMSDNGDVTGYHNQEDYWIVKLDGNANIVWQKALGGNQTDVAQSVQQTADNGYIIAGYSRSTNADVTGNHGTFDYWIVKLISNGTLLWQKSLGGSLSDKAYALLVTPDQGYIIAGSSASNNGDVTKKSGKNDFWLVKTDANANIQWQQAYGGNNDDEPLALTQVSDGGYLLSGYSNSQGDDVSFHYEYYQNPDAWLVKTNETGDLTWTKVIGGTGSDQLYGLIENSEGNYVAVGFTDSKDGDVVTGHGKQDMWITNLSSTVPPSDFYKDADEDGYGNSSIHVSACIAPEGFVANNADCNDSNPAIHPGSVELCNGLDDNCDGSIDVASLLNNISWVNLLGGNDQEKPAHIIPTADGGFISAGYSESHDGDVIGHHGINGSSDAWIVKQNSDGSMQWNRCYGGTSSDLANAIIQTPDGGYVFCGYTASDDGDIIGDQTEQPAWIVKLDNSGNILWQKYYLGTDGATATSIFQTTDNGFIVAASKDGDFWILKLDVNGNLQWDKTLGGPESDVPKVILQSGDGGYVVAGSTDSHSGNVDCNSSGDRSFWLIKLDAGGNMTWQSCFGTEVDDNLHDMKSTNDGGYILAGSSFYSNGDNDYLVIKTDEEGNLQWQKAFGGSYDDDCFAAGQLPNGEYIVCGSSSSSDGDVSDHLGSTYYTDLWLLTLDQNGNLIEDKSLYSLNSDFATAMNMTPNGGAIVAGFTYGYDAFVPGYHASTDYIVVSLAPAANASTTFYADTDGDSYGNAAVTVLACSAPVGYVSDNTDCNDNNAAIHPGAIEITNGIDDNCNNQVDENASCTVPSDLHASNITSTTANLHWNFSGEALKFIINYKGSDGSYVKLNVPGLQTSYHLTGLSANTIYKWGVKAKCSSGSSPFSSSAVFTTNLKMNWGESDEVSPIIKVYPNPASEDAQVEISEAGMTNVIIDVTDMSGRVLLSFGAINCDGTCSRKVNVRMLPAGAYLVRVETAEMVQTHSLMISK